MEKLQDKKVINFDFHSLRAPAPGRQGFRKQNGFAARQLRQHKESQVPGRVLTGGKNFDPYFFIYFSFHAIPSIFQKMFKNFFYFLH